MSRPDPLIMSADIARVAAERPEMGDELVSSQQEEAVVNEVVRWSAALLELDVFQILDVPAEGAEDRHDPDMVCRPTADAAISSRLRIPVIDEDHEVQVGRVGPDLDEPGISKASGLGSLGVGDRAQGVAVDEELRRLQRHRRRVERTDGEGSLHRADPQPKDGPRLVPGHRCQASSRDRPARRDGGRPSADDHSIVCSPLRPTRAG